MKHSHFKIRKPEEQSKAQQQSMAELLKTSFEQTNSKLSSLMTLFEVFMKTSIQQSANQSSTKINTQSLECEVRDRQVFISIPQVQYLCKQDSEKWISQVCFATFSNSFHYYLTEQMTFQQTKVFCSQNILKNLLRYVQKYKPTEDQLQNINTHIGQKVFEYLQKKYPLAQSNDINKALQKEVQQTNHIDLLTNDFLYNSKIMFKYSQDGNYNDMIMKVVNKAIQIAQENSGHSQSADKANQSNFNDFRNFMSNLFENVYDQQWMLKTKDLANINNAGNKAEKQEINKEKYQELVKEYTHYLIGRKISENTTVYTQSQIKTKNLSIKSPAVLRILTKWCQQLWEKFQNPTYFRERAESIQLQNPQMINPFVKWMKDRIDLYKNIEKDKILAFKKQLDRNSYGHQAQFLVKHLQEDGITNIPKYEKASGKFATQMVKNLHSYITLYLNRLIHGLLSVSKIFYQEQILSDWQDWQSPPNLITFKIGDLMRCKVSSKQKEIVSILKQIKRISNQNPQRLKIIRVKNRLKQGTHDILINIKFNNSFICEIQLEVINKSKSKFIQCSNSFSHYIYQMKRSIFGPISEICNIWYNFQPRALFYQPLIKQAKNINAHSPSEKCVQDKNQVEQQLSNDGHNFIKFDLPFQCSYCRTLYYHNNFIISNKKCEKCNRYKCVKCQINKMEEQQLKKIIFKNKNDKELSQSCSRLTQKAIPHLGLCVKIESNFVKIQIFQRIKYEGKVRILGVKNGKAYNIKTLRTQKDSLDFLSKNCIFQIVKNKTSFIQITESMKKIFSTQQYLKECYRQQRQVLVLTQLQCTQKEIINLMKVDGGYQHNNKKIKKLEFVDNQSKNISFLQCFQNLTSINISNNNILDISPLAKFKCLQKLQINSNANNISFDEKLCTSLDKLEQIKITDCIITTLPQNIGSLTQLSSINMDRCLIEKLPQTICSISNLKQMRFSRNKLTSLPDQIGKLVSLKKLLLNSNFIDRLPQSISKLQNLQILDLSKNKFSRIDNIVFPSKLQVLRFQENCLQSFSSLTQLNQALKQLNFSKNKLKSIDINFQNHPNLQMLRLEQNELAFLPQNLKTCTKLQCLNVFNNKLIQIPEWFSLLKRLSPLINFSSNCLKQFPYYIFKAQTVVQINLTHNQITEIPNNLYKLTEMKVLKLANNKIKSLSKELTYIQQSFQLEITNNQIEYLPNYVQQILPIKQNIAKWPQYFANNKVNSFQQNFELFNLLDNCLALNKNQLTSIPMSLISNKQNILNINFDSNKIKQIPLDIVLFVSLQYLSLRNNLIEVIPKELQQLKQMVFLKLNRNPIKQVQCLQYCSQVTTKQFYQFLLNPLEKQIIVEEDF